MKFGVFGGDEIFTRIDDDPFNVVGIVTDNMEPAMTFSWRRETLRLSRSEVADRAGLDERIIATVERPDTCSNIHFLGKVAKVLGLNSNYISVRKGNLGKGYLYDE